MLHILLSKATIMSLIIIGSIIAIVIFISPQKEITGLIIGDQMNESNETGFTTNATTNITDIISDGTGAMNGNINETNITESPPGSELVEPSIKLLKPQYYAGEDIILEVRSGDKITNVLVLDPVGNNYTCSKVEPADGAELCILERKTAIVLGNYIVFLLEDQTILDQIGFEIIPLPELEISVATDKTLYTQGEVVHVLIKTNREAIISTKIIDPLEREELLETHKINLTYYTANFIDTTNIILGNYTVIVTTTEINASVIFEITYTPPITSHNIVKNALGELLEGEIIFRQVDIEKHKTDLGEVLQIPRGVYDIEIRLIDQPIKSILLRNVSLQKDVTNIILFDDAPETDDFLEVFAIDPVIDFSKAEVLRHSKGAVLYKCKDWDFPNRLCLGDWIRIQDMEEDEDYLFTFDSSDPGFGEGKRKEKPNVTFDRDLECGPTCGKHKAPPETNVNMTITAIVIEPMEDVTFSDIYNTEWTVTNPNQGNISTYNTTHNKISWYVGNVSGSVSRWYVINSPKRELPPKKYYFISELDGYQSDPWMVIVADPPGKIYDKLYEPCTSETSCIPATNATEGLRYNVSVFWYEGTGNADSWDFDTYLQYGANISTGEDAATDVPRGIVCGTNATILIDEYVVYCTTDNWTCTDYDNGTITITSTGDSFPKANISYEVEFCSSAAGNKYDLIQEVVDRSSPSSVVRDSWVEAWGITPAIKILNVTLITPAAGSSTNVSQGTTFWVNASVRCLNGDCGTVVGSVRYNSTTAEPDINISVTPSGTPFYNVSGEIPWSCGTMSKDELCTLNWTLNATGAPWNSYYMDVNFTSSVGAIPDNDTANFQINITETLYCTGSVYNPPGNWDITAATTCIDRDIPVDGNITISGSGSLTLIRTNITFNITANQNFFFVNSVDMWSINSTIKTNDTNYGFKFNITTGKGAGNVVQLNGTNITSSGWWAFPAVDIWIYNSDNIVIKDSNITNTNAILIQDSEGNLLIDNSNMTFTGSSHGIRLVNTSNVTISGNKINATYGYGISGISYSWVNDTTIYDNWIYPSGSRTGIYIALSGPGNNITENDIWGNNDVIYISSDQLLKSSSIIAHNTLESIGAGSTYGIWTQYQDNVTVFNNTIDVTSQGIFLFSGNGANITGNRITSSGTMWAFSMSSNFTNVFENNFTSHSPGVATVSGYNLTFYKNIFILETMAGIGRMGLYLGDVYNSNFTENNVTIRLGLGDALNLTRSDQNTFYNNIFWAEPMEANNSITVFAGTTRFGKIFENSFTNDKLTSGWWSKDIWFNDTGIVNFTNVSFFENTGFKAGSNASLYVNWYVKGYVNDSSANPIQDANFSAWNVSDDFLWWNWTDTNGYTDIMTIQEYVENISGQSSQQNTTFNATKTSYETGEVSLNISTPDPYNPPPFIQVNITLLVSGGTLNVTLITPAAGSSTNVSQNTTFKVNASIRCMGGNCGTVVGSVRYNRTTANPDFLINTTLNGIPFSNSTGQIPWSCGTLNQNQLCTLNWTVNATGTINTSYYLDVNFTSSVGAIPDNDTANFQINISRPPDQTPPSVTINDPNAGENHSGDILINATVTDSYSGVDDSKVYYWIENVSGNVTAWTQMSNISSGDGSFFNATFDSTSVSDGTYNVTINASDIAGNENVTEKVEFVIDNTNPAVGYIEPSQDENKTSSFLINVSINDSTSGIETVYYWIENVSGNVTAWTAMSLGAGTIYQGFWNATFDPSPLAYDKYNITTNTTDYAGNKNVTEKRQFIYTTPILNVTLITPAADSSTNVTQNTTFNVNASVRCLVGDCGTVSGSVRYNRTTANPDFLINTTLNGIPFSNSTGEIPWSCGTLNQNQLCTLNWTVNATGDTGTSYYLDVNFTSSLSNVPDNDTANFQINITRLPYCFPNGNYSGEGNWDISGSVICENETIWLNGNLSVFNAANLTFKNITLRVNGSSDGEYSIFVGGSMYVARFSNVTNGETAAAEFRFEINLSASVLHFNDSYLSESGWNDDYPGLKVSRTGAVYEKNIKIINSTIKNCYSGVTFYKVDDSEIKNSNLSDGYYGIWMTGGPGVTADRTEIKGNEIYNYSQGIRGDEYARNTTIFNNSIRNSTTAVFFGLGACGPPSFFYYNISKNNISQSGFGVTSASTAGNTIEGNDFESITNTAIDFSCYIWNSTVSNNRVSNSNISLLLWTGVYNNTIISNNLTGSNTYGMRLSSAVDNEIRNNNITSTANGYGIYAADSDNNEFRNNHVKSANENAIYLTGSDGVTITNSTIETTGTGYYTLNYTASSYVIIYNSTLISVNNNTDIQMRTTGNLTLVNVTFNKSAVDFTQATTTKLYVKWYVKGYVNDSSANPIQDVNFTAWNVTDDFLWWNWTSATGYTDWTEIQEYIQNISANVSQQNTTFNATKTGYKTGKVNLNVTTSMQVNITLLPPYCFPNGNYSGEGNWDISGSVICENETIWLNGNLTVLNGADLTFKNITLRVNGTSPNVTHIFVGGSMYVARFSNITNGENSTYKFRFEVNKTADNFHLNDSYLFYAGWGVRNSGLVLWNNNSVIKNNSIKNVFHGVNLSSTSLGGSSHNRIFNNTIFSKQTTIMMANSTNNSIQDNHLNNSAAGKAIYLLTNCDNNIIRGNSMMGSSAIKLMYGSNNNTISWNNMTASGSVVGLYRSHNNTFLNNNITSKITVGVDVDESRNTNLTNNNITASTRVMIIRTFSNDTFIYNTTIKAGVNEGIEIKGSSNGTIIIDSTLEATSSGQFAIINNNSFYGKVYNSTLLSVNSNRDIQMRNTGNLTVVNVSFNKSGVDYTLATTTKLYVKWYVKGYVNDSSANPIQNVNFSAWNVSDDFLWWNWTSATGYIDWTEIQEYVENKSDQNSQQNTTFNATKAGYQTGEVSLNITGSTQVNITLSGFGILNVTQVYPLGGSSTVVTQYTAFWVNASVRCMGDTGATCGSVQGIARYNWTSEDPDTPINTTPADSPFYIISSIDKWYNMNPSSKPSGRADHAMAYDSANNRTILFGGWDGAYDGETWVYNYSDNNWYNMNPSSSPSGRYGHTMVYDSLNNRTILFGGDNGTSTSETWVYNYSDNNWYDMSPSNNPSARQDHAMVYDSLNNRTILFGGEGVDDKTWVYNFSDNDWYDMSPSNDPDTRDELAMAYDSLNNRTILFGGWSAGFLGDTWVYNFSDNDWYNMSPSNNPGARADHTVVYDSLNNRIILFGGYDSGGYDNETWIYDFSKNNWYKMSPSDSPSPRDVHAMAYDSLNNRTILFGGYNDTFLSDTWTYEYIAKNPLYCGTLDVGDSPCQLNWTVNATGTTPPEQYWLDVNFSSDNAYVPANDTQDFQINISGAAEPSNTSLEKALTNTSTLDKYQIILNVTNRGGGGNVIITVHDFVPSGFNASNFSPIYTDNASYQGGYIYIWNLTISGGDSQLIYYNITGSSDYNVTKTYLIGIDPIPFLIRDNNH